MFPDRFQLENQFEWEPTFAKCFSRYKSLFIKSSAIYQLPTSNSVTQSLSLNQCQADETMSQLLEDSAYFNNCSDGGGDKDGSAEKPEDAEDLVPKSVRGDSELERDTDV